MIKVGMTVKVVPAKDKGKASLASLMWVGSIGKVIKVIEKGTPRSYLHVDLKGIKGTFALNMDEVKVVDSRMDYSVRVAKNKPEET